MDAAPVTFKAVDRSGFLFYNCIMEPKKCNSNPVAKYIRIAVSLLIIALGIIYKNPMGFLGFFTLYTAFTGQCGAGGISFRGKGGVKLEKIDFPSEKS